LKPLPASRLRHWLHSLVHLRPKLLLDLFSLAGGQAFSMVVGLLIFAGYLARTLSPASYGAVEYAIGLAALFAIVVECGLGPIAARQLAQDRSLAPKLVMQIAGARLLVAFVAVPAMYFIYYFSGNGDQFRVLIALFAFSLFAIPWRQDWLLQGLGRMTPAAMAQAVKMAVFAVAVLLTVHGPDDFTMVGVAEVGAAAAMVLYYVAAQIRSGVPLGFRLAIAESRQLIGEGISLSLSSILWAFVLYMPLFLVTSLAGSTETAWYGASQRIVVSLLNFSFIYFFNFYPVMAARLHRREEWSRLLLSSYRLLAWSGIGLALCLAILSKPLARLAFGADFAPAAPVLALLIWVLPIRLLSGHARWTLVAGGRQTYLLYSEIIGASVLIVAGAVIIPLAGAQGAAGAAVLANLGNWVSAHVFASRQVSALPSLRHWLAPAMAACAGGGLAFVATPSPLVAVSIGLSVYLLCFVFFTKELLADVRILAYARTDGGIGDYGKR
jgi:O-antigen/teichoic acid export membrane protein